MGPCYDRGVHPVHRIMLPIWLMSILPGCQTSQPMATPTPAVRFESLIGAEQPITPILPPLQTLSSGRWSYAMWVGPPNTDASPAPPQSVDLTLQRTDAPASPFRRTTPNGRTEHLMIDVDGGIVITATEEPAHNALTQYDPPLTLFPASLKPGVAHRTEHAMIILALNDPATQRDKGQCTKTITHEADQRVTGPHGPVRCARLKVIIEAQLGLARVRTVETLWVHPELGLVASDSTEAVTALLPLWVTRERLVLRQVHASP